MNKKIKIILFIFTASCSSSTQYVPSKSFRLSQVEVMSIGNKRDNARLDAVCINTGEQVLCATSVDEHYQGSNDENVDFSSLPILPETVLGFPETEIKPDCQDYRKESLALAKNGYVTLSFGGVIDIYNKDKIIIYFKSSNGGFPCPKVLHKITAIQENGSRVHLCETAETAECSFTVK